MKLWKLYRACQWSVPPLQVTLMWRLFLITLRCLDRGRESIRCSRPTSSFFFNSFSSCIAICRHYNKKGIHTSPDQLSFIYTHKSGKSRRYIESAVFDGRTFHPLVVAQKNKYRKVWPLLRNSWSFMNVYTAALRFILFRASVLPVPLTTLQYSHRYRRGSTRWGHQLCCETAAQERVHGLNNDRTAAALQSNAHSPRMLYTRSLPRRRNKKKHSWMTVNRVWLGCRGWRNNSSTSERMQRILLCHQLNSVVCTARDDMTAKNSRVCFCGSAF